MSMTITRRQHYVWKHYLTAWTQCGKISVVRADGASFQTDPANVALERDFYRLPILSLADEQFVSQFIESGTEDLMLRKLNIAWLDSFAGPSRLRRILSKKGIHTFELKELIENMEIQSEENLHSRIEDSSVRLLDKLRLGEISIWQDDRDARALSFFLALQHLRTKNMRDRLASKFPEAPTRELVARCWPVLRVVLATNLGWSLFSGRANWRLRLLNAANELQFITTDQPLRNLKIGEGHDDLALFYPVSPNRAVLLEHIHQESIVGNHDNLPEALVSQLNQKMYEGSHEQIFGNDLEYLRSFGVNKP